ncbi:hypothetical protein IJJ49_01215 [Candidatus Saccharibacteria bacterium]|nr:hypothetical protein [Candidatus Saccharibacteria bacterium]
MQKIDEFLKGLLKKKGITELTPEIEESVLSDMKSRLLEQINKAAILALPEEKVIELSKISENSASSQSEINEFMEKSGVDFNKVVRETCERFSKLYLGEEI